MKKAITIIIVTIVAVIIIAVFAVNITGYWPFLNKPINYLVAGAPNKSCQTDSDCEIKPTHCGYCGDCGEAVNKNWQQYCPFKTHFFVLMCEGCQPLQSKCIKGQCQSQKYAQKQVTDFESCVTAGNQIMESYPRQCRANGQTFTEILKAVGESCGQSSDCQLPMDYAVRSNCPYQAYCYNQRCAVGCPQWQSQTEQWVVKCQNKSDCNCAVWDPEHKYTCACVDEKCASIVSGINTGNGSQSVACTQEAKLCPNGSYVSRTGPNCEFAPCPITDSSSRMDLEAKGYECVQNKGDWLDQYNECEYISQDWCLKQEGIFDGCASACRHDPEATICTMQCVPVCQFQ